MNARNKMTRHGSRNQYKGVCLRKDLRLAIYLRDRFTCLLCLQDLHGASPSDITLDHVHVHADGGSNEPTNLYVCCRTCNCSRQDKPLARVAGPETRAHIRRNTARKIGPYRAMSKAIIAGTTENPRGNC